MKYAVTVSPSMDFSGASGDMSQHVKNVSPSSKDPASESNESLKSVAVSVSEATNLSSSNDSRSTDSQMNDEAIPTTIVDIPTMAKSMLSKPSISETSP